MQLVWGEEGFVLGVVEEHISVSLRVAEHISVSLGVAEHISVSLGSRSLGG